MKFRAVYLAMAALCLVFSASFAAAGSVNFDDVTAPADFNQVPFYAPTVYPGVQFNNGVILNDTDYANMATTKPNLYATSDFLPLGDGTFLAGNIDAVFSPFASNVSFDLINGGIASNFMLFAFDSSGNTLDSQTIGLTDFGTIGSVAHVTMNVSGIFQVVIDSSQGTGNIDFATDTWNWNGGTTPEPASLLLLGTAVTGIWTQRKRFLR